MHDATLPLGCLAVSLVLGLRCPYFALFLVAAVATTAGAIGLIVRGVRYFVQ